MRFYSSEKFESIADELNRRQWLQATEEDGQNDLLWLNLKSIQFDSVGTDTIVNHMKGSQHLSNKALFAYHMHTSGLGHSLLPANWSSGYQDLGQLLVLVLLNSIYSLSKAVVSHPAPLLKEHMSLISQYKEILRYCSADKELNPVSLQNCCWLVAVLATGNIDKQKLLVELSKLENSERWRSRWGGISNIFIVKPVGLSCGEQIEVTQGLYETLKCVEAFQFKCVVQKYIERPLLVRKNRKFDIRQWILVTSAEPLVVFGYSECYLRLSSEEYSLDGAKLGEAQVHLCNHAIQKFHNREATATPADVISEDGTMYDTMMTQSEFNKELVHRAIPVWGGCLSPFESFIQPKIQRACVTAVQSCRDRLQRVGRGFEWLGVDLMVSLSSTGDDAAAAAIRVDAATTAASDVVDVLVLEVNVSPDISLSTPVTARLVNLAIPDLFSLLLDEPTLEMTSFSTDYHRMPSKTATDTVEVARKPKWELWYQTSDETESGKRPQTVLQFAHAKRSVEVLHTGDYRPRKLELFNSVMNILKKSASSSSSSGGGEEGSSAVDEDEDDDEI